MKSTGNIDFIVRGKISDLEISPNHISVSLLNSFSKDISDLLNTIQEAKKEQIIVSIEEGSFKIKAAMFMAAINIINAEIKTLQETNDLNSINEKRGLIYEKWISNAIENNYEFEIKPQNDDSLIINKNTVFNKIDNSIWVESEIYLYGVITDLGGSQKPNIHLKLEDGKSIVIDCTKDDIANEIENRVYHSASIRVTAKQNLITGELKEFKFSSYNKYNPVFDEKALLETIDKGTNAWSNVENHIDWVRNLRTDNE
jgi:hypothetical protein